MIRKSSPLILLLTSLFLLLPLSPSHALPANPTIPDSILDATWKSLPEPQQKVAEEMLSILQSKGFSKESAVGILGNVWQESGFRADAQHGSSGACSFFQWFSTRKSNLEAFTKKDCKQTTPKEGIEFALSEGTEGRVTQISNPALIKQDILSYAKKSLADEGISAELPKPSDKFSSYDEMKKSKNWSFVTWIWLVNWEIPGPGESVFGKRLKYAATLMKHLKGGATVSETSSDNSTDSADLPTNPWLLEGMPKKPELPKGNPVELPNSSALDVNQKANLQELQDTYQSDKSYSFYFYLKLATSALGYLLFIYTFFLVVAIVGEMLIDSKDSFLLKLVTFGRFSFNPEATFNTPNQLNIQKGILLVSGFALVSGLLLTDFFLSIVTSILSFFAGI